ncbi:MAG TPA: hypothetical protein VFD70_21600 [Anaerolineae bacterium]|nr:hypothetical protein [Anaerolineae bacterium]
MRSNALKSSASLQVPRLAKQPAPRNRRKIMLEILLVVVGIVVLFLLIGWIGLQIKPALFSPFPLAQPKLETIALPTGLPAQSNLRAAKHP